jgi:small subunit ribosomal protein S17
MKKTLTGQVVSAKMTMSATVAVTRFHMHPKYGKRVKRSKKYLVHNALDAKEGQIVAIEETKPMSKNKHWQITKII